MYQILNSIHQYPWILETFKNLDGLVMEDSVYSGGGNKFQQCVPEQGHGEVEVDLVICFQDHLTLDTSNLNPSDPLFHPFQNADSPQAKEGQYSTSDQ